MAVYNSLQPLSQVADVPVFEKPTWFRDRNGNSTTFGNIFNTAVPALTTVAGTLLGGPVGTSIGSAAGQAIVGAVNRDQSKRARLDGAVDAQAKIDNDLGPDMARAGLVSNLTGLVNFTPGRPAVASTVNSPSQAVNPQADVADLGAGALDVTGMTGYNQAKNKLVNQFNQSSTGTPGSPMQVNVDSPDPSLLPTLIQQGVTGFGPRNRDYRLQGSTYQTFAEGGLPIAPLAISTRSMDGRDRRRQQRLAEGLGERVDAELANNQEAIRAQQAQAFQDSFNQQRAIQAPALRTEVNNPAAVEGNIDGANYVRNYMTQRGYGAETANVGTPQLLRPADFRTATDHPEAAGVYVARRDQSYVMDNYDKATTRSYSAHETTHDAQDALVNNPEMQRSLGVLRSRVTNNADPYLADPQEIQARLMQMREGVNQDATKPFNRTKWRLGNILNTLTFGLANKAQNEAFREAKSVMGRKNVFQSLNDTFAEGGKSGTSYTRYHPSDLTSEDIIMTHKKTGMKVGEMRFGERIYDQEATDKIDKSVRTLRLNPNADGFYQLGKFIYDETLTHKDQQPVMQRFAEGGKTEAPVKPSDSIRRAQEKMKQAGLYAGPVNGLYTPQTHKAVKHWNGTARLIPGRTPISWVDSNDDYVHDLKDDTPWNYGSKDTFQNEPFVIENVKQKRNSLLNLMPPEGEVGFIPPAPESSTTPQPTPGTNYDPRIPRTSTIPTSPTIAPSAPTNNSGGYNWLSPGNIADAARTFIGYTQANRDLPNNPINPDYLKLVADAKQQSDQGLGPASKQLFNSQINDSRSLGIEAIRRATGGGGSAGAAIAGLGQLNDATSNAALKLAAADDQAKIYNQYRYQNLLGGLIDQQQQRFGMAYNAALVNKQAGLNLAQQGLSGIQNRYDVWNMYDNPDSALAKFSALQQENMAADTRATKTNYASIGRLLGGVN